MINKNRPPPLAGSTRSRPPVAPPAADRRRRPRNGPPAPGPRTWPVSPRALPQGLRENMRNEGSIRENLGTWDKNMLINHENGKKSDKLRWETEKFDEIWAFMGFRQKLVMI